MTLSLDQLEDCAVRTALAVNTFDNDVVWEGYAEYVFSRDELKAFFEAIVKEEKLWAK